MKTRWNDDTLVRRLAALAGAMDLATGLGLVGAPAWTLGWMGVTAPGAEALVFLRWVGAFVGAVGASYWVALVRGGRGPLREVLATTALLRLAAGGYCAAAVFSGVLGVRWALVPATDLALAAAQVLWLVRSRAEGGGRS